MGAVHRHGRAAQIREVLVQFPTGATTAEIITAGDIKASIAAVGKSLMTMREQEQVTMKMGHNTILWALTPRIRQAMAATASPASNDPNRCPPSMPRVRAGDSATTVRHREQDRHEIAAQIEAFKHSGGQIEVLGNTPLKGSKTRRQVIEGTGPTPRPATEGER